MTENTVNEDKYDKFGFRLENFDLYKPKKWYISVTPEEEVELAANLNEIEKKISELPFSEDIPR